jgi:hypothetical protein
MMQFISLNRQYRREECVDGGRAGKCSTYRSDVVLVHLRLRYNAVQCRDDNVRCEMR